MIGYTDKWRDYSAVEIRRDDYYGNVVRAARAESRRQIDRTGGKVDKRALAEREAVVVGTLQEAYEVLGLAEPHFEPSAENHHFALAAGYISVNSYEDRPWASGSIVSPSTATGVMLKLLRYDPLTEAMTFLYCMTPEYIQDNISYHDCAEESYHIWGTSWMMQFGDLPTGGYFWRPPFIIAVLVLKFQRRVWWKMTCKFEVHELYCCGFEGEHAPAHEM